MADVKPTYIAYDELRLDDPGQTDYRYCATIQRWAAEGNAYGVSFLDRQTKVYAVRKSSLRPALTSRIRELLTLSRNVLIILSDDTRKSGSMLSYEIEEAVDNFNLPLILAYIDYKAIAEPAALSECWPNALRQRINSGTARAIHIPFNKYAILDAVNQFTDTNRPLTGLNHYTEQAHRKFRCIDADIPFGNIMRQKRFVAGN